MARCFWPCWFDGGQGFVNLSKKFVEVKGAMEYVLAYPSDRAKDTPLAMFTPVDIVRQTLGVGPCEYVLDREGLSQRSVNEGRKVLAAASATPRRRSNTVSPQHRMPRPPPRQAHG